jgi:glycosyltransferase involved in cell wall biosynthesis
MISILIPVYNYPIIELAKELIIQGKELGFPFEIIFFDDCSPDREIQTDNQGFCKENGLVYIISEHNLGRAKARNFLASQARYGWLLFLDSDVFPVNKDFLRTYVFSVAENFLVFSGNILYRKGIISGKKKSLRYKYGVKYEEVPMKKRGKSEYLHVKSANFFIKKELFFQVEFPVLKFNYGFEDTVFGLMLQDMGIKIKLLENPVYHDGLEDNDVFLAKTEEAVKNLVDLIREVNPLCEKIRMVKLYSLLKRTGLSEPIRWFFIANEKSMRKNLLSENPNIKLFQLYKLGYLCELLARK